MKNPTATPISNPSHLDAFILEGFVQSLRYAHDACGLPAVLRHLADHCEDMADTMDDKDFKTEAGRRADALRTLAADFSGE